MRRGRKFCFSRRVAALAVCLSCACTGANPNFDDRDGATDGRRPLDSIAEGIADRAPDLRVDLAPADAPPVNIPGLIAYWQFDEGTESRVARDSTAGGHHGMLEGLDPTTSWVPGWRGWGLEFKDAGDRAGVRVMPSRAVDELRNYTISAWFQRSVLRPGAYTSLISRQLRPDHTEVFNLGVVQDRLRAYLPPRLDNGTVYNASAPSVAPLNVWVHGAATFDGRVLRLYQDGVQVDSTNSTLALPASTFPVYLGTNVNEQDERDQFIGILDEVRLYNIALSASEVAALARKP